MRFEKFLTFMFVFMIFTSVNMYSLDQKLPSLLDESITGIKVKRTPYLMDLIEKVKVGDLKLFNDMRFTTYKDILLILKEDADNEKLSPVDNFGDKPFQIKNAIKTFVGGLSNLDPRIRVSSAKTLRSLLTKYKELKVPNKDDEGREYTPEDKEKLARQYQDNYHAILKAMKPFTRKAWYIETVTRKRYLTTNVLGEEVKNPIVYEEINCLDLYVTRELTVKRIDEGEMLDQDFVYVNPRTFKALTERICSDDNENYIPIYYLNDSVSILIYSLNNYDPKVRKKAAHLLVQLYYSPAIASDNQTKLKIEKARLDSIELDEAFKDYIGQQEELQRIREAEAKKAAEEAEARRKKETEVDKEELKRIEAELLAEEKARKEREEALKNQKDANKKEESSKDKDSDKDKNSDKDKDSDKDSKADFEGKDGTEYNWWRFLRRSGGKANTNIPD